MRNEQYQTSGFEKAAELYRVNDWQRVDIPLPDNRATQWENVAVAFTALWEDFHAAIHEDREPAAPARAGAEALELALAAYTAAVIGRTVTLPLATDHPVYQRGLAGLRCRVDRRGGQSLGAG